MLVRHVAGSTDQLLESPPGRPGTRPEAATGPLRQALAMASLDVAALLLRATAVLLLLSPLLLGVLFFTR